MTKYRFWTIILLLVIVLAGWFVYASEMKDTGIFAKTHFKLGLDLAGGTELTYKADVSQVPANQIADSMNTLKDVIERRVNLFGVGEPVVQVEQASSLGATKDNKLIVELPGVTDVNKAIALIGQTPTLDFKLVKPGEETALRDATTSEEANKHFISTGLTGRFVQSAQVQFAPNTNEPEVLLTFNAEGKAMFAKITKENVNKTLAIFLDNEPISTPTIREEIADGKAVISGNFKADEAKKLVRDLNYGALPIPVELVGTETVGPSLGRDALFAGIKAGLWGLALVALFLILWYRLPGFVATISLVMYTALSLVAFKIFHITLTAAGLAGFILSIGMAVDANILIFERMKEELKRGKNIYDAMHEGFHRAWLSIRDSNISSIITALVLFWLGTSSVRGFALTLGLGVVISMFTAITVSRTFLFAIIPKGEGKVSRFLFSNGVRK